MLRRKFALPIVLFFSGITNLAYPNQGELLCGDKRYKHNVTLSLHTQPLCRCLATESALTGYMANGRFRDRSVLAVSRPYLITVRPSLSTSPFQCASRTLTPHHEMRILTATTGNI